MLGQSPDRRAARGLAGVQLEPRRRRGHFGAGSIPRQPTRQDIDSDSPAS